MKDTQGNEDVKLSDMTPEGGWEKELDNLLKIIGFKDTLSFESMPADFQLKLFIQKECNKAYKLGMCVGVQEESERWSEMIPTIKERAIDNRNREIAKWADEHTGAGGDTPYMDLLEFLSTSSPLIRETNYMKNAKNL